MKTHERLKAFDLFGLVLFAFAACTLGTPVTSLAQEKARLEALAGQKNHDQFIVKYRDGAVELRDSAAANRSAAEVAGKLRGTLGQSFSLQRVRAAANGSQVLKSGKNLDRVEAALLMRLLASNPDVEYVEPDREAHALSVPNDTDFSLQWYMTEWVGGNDAAYAWDYSTGDPNILIAVLDSGITNHSDLNSKKVGGYDFVTDTSRSKDGNGRDPDPADPGTFSPAIMDDPCVGDFPCSNLSPSDWHGTVVAGIAAAATNNSSGIAGVGYNARFVPIRVLGRGGSGHLSDVADAIRWASGAAVAGVPANPYPAKIINLSLGWETFDACSPTLQSAIDTAYSNGATVIAAAGNSNSSSLIQPAKCNNVISVAATNRAGNRAYYSSYASWITISAPGGVGTAADGIYSTSNTGTQGPAAQTYKYGEGSSMSAPQVAGVVALIQKRALDLCGSQLAPDTIRSILINAAAHCAAPPPANQQIGAGIVSASGAFFEVAKICDVMIPPH